MTHLKNRHVELSTRAASRDGCTGLRRVLLRRGGGRGWEVVE